MRWKSAPAHAQEREWLQRARQNDGEAFRHIFERHRPAVRRYLDDLLRSPHLAEEGAQETFVRAHERLHQLRADEKLLPWLLGIARLVSLELRRGARRSAEADSADDGALPVAVIPAPSPERVLMDRELSEALSLGLAALPEPRRAALLLRVDHGLSYEEIALAMGWPLQKVKNELHRARLGLRLHLAPHFSGGDP